MKIYIFTLALLDKYGKEYGYIDDDANFVPKMTDDEVIEMCELDKDCEEHNVFNSIEEMTKAWNDEEIISPARAYMRVIND